MRWIFIVLMLGVTSFCFGQKKESKKSPEEKSLEMANELKKDLELSKDQYEKVKLIYVKYLKEKSELNVKIKEIEKQKKALKKSRNTMINNVLSVEQKKELVKQKIKKKRRK